MLSALSQPRRHQDHYHKRFDDNVIPLNTSVIILAMFKGNMSEN